MAMVYDVTIKTPRMQAVADAIDGGSLELQAADDAVLAAFTLEDPSGVVSGAVLTLDGAPLATEGTAAASTGTTVTKARIKSAGGTVLITGLTVGLDGSGAMIILDNVNIAEGQGVTITAATITHAA